MTTQRIYKYSPKQLQAQGLVYSPVPEDVRRMIIEYAGDRAFSLYAEAISHAKNFQVTAKLLAKRLNWNAKTVTKYLKRLRELGLATIQKLRANDGGRFVGSCYRFSQVPREEWKMAEVQTDLFCDDRDTISPPDQELPPVDNYDEDLTNINFKDAQAEPPTHEPLAIPQLEQPATDQDKDKAFERFWHSYPRKLDKKRARTVFTRLTKGLVKGELAALMTKIGCNIDTRSRYDAQWLRSIATDKRTIPYPKTYLANERWQDEWAPNLNGSPFQNQWGELKTFCEMGGTPEEFLGAR